MSVFWIGITPYIDSLGRKWKKLTWIKVNGIYIEDNDRVKGKEDLVIMSWREAGQEDFWKEATAHIMQCSLCNNLVGTQLNWTDAGNLWQLCWGFQSPESDWSHTVEHSLSSALTGFLRNLPAGLDLNMGFGDYISPISFLTSLGNHFFQIINTYFLPDFKL